MDIGNNAGLRVASSLCETKCRRLIPKLRDRATGGSNVGLELNLLRDVKELLIILESASTTMPSGYLHSVTMTLWSEPSEFSETTRLSLRSRRNRRPTVAVSPDARCGACFGELTMYFHSKWSVGIRAQRPISLLRQAIPSLRDSPKMSMWLTTTIGSEGCPAMTPSNLDPRAHDHGPVFGQAEGLGGVGAQVTQGDEEIPTPRGHGRLPACLRTDSHLGECKYSPDKPVAAPIAHRRHPLAAGPDPPALPTRCTGADAGAHRRRRDP
jgi:hypothetical protein